MYASGSESKTTVEPALLKNLLTNVKYMYCTTPTTYIYCVKVDFYTVRANCLGDASVPSLTITADSGNEQVGTVLCVCVTVNWNFFHVLKVHQVLLSS